VRRGRNLAPSGRESQRNNAKRRQVYTQVNGNDQEDYPTTTHTTEQKVHRRRSRFPMGGSIPS
jgi:hypothetical protein